MRPFDVLADAFDYPAGDWLERLAAGCAALEPGAERDGITAFLKRMEALSASEREEQYTRMFDLNPLAPPYVGYLVYGDNYQRGAFMARLKRAQDALGVDSEGELPDHLRLVLRYLARATSPLPELLELLPSALKKIGKNIATFERKSPYQGLLDTTERAVMRLRVPFQGGRE